MTAYLLSLPPFPFNNKPYTSHVYSDSSPRTLSFVSSERTPMCGHVLFFQCPSRLVSLCLKRASSENTLILGEAAGKDVRGDVSST
jgi:hypothetical protein